MNKQNLAIKLESLLILQGLKTYLTHLTNINLIWNLNNNLKYYGHAWLGWDLKCDANSFVQNTITINLLNFMCFALILTQNALQILTSKSQFIYLKFKPWCLLTVFAKKADMVLDLSYMQEILSVFLGHQEWEKQVLDVQLHGLWTVSSSDSLLKD